MKNDDELKVEREPLEQQKIEAKKHERAEALKKVKKLC